MPQAVKQLDTKLLGNFDVTALGQRSSIKLELSGYPGKMIPSLPCKQFPLILEPPV